MKKLETTRMKMAELREEFLHLQAQTRSREEVRAKVTSMVDGWHKEAQVNQRYLLRLLANGQSARFFDMEHPYNLGVDLTMALGPDAMKQALLRQIDSIPVGMPTEDRDGRLAVLATDIYVLEMEEEKIISQAEERGEFIMRRVDARPELVLARR